MTHPLASPNNQIYHLENYITKSNSENGRTEHFVLMTETVKYITKQRLPPLQHARLNASSRKFTCAETNSNLPKLKYISGDAFAIIPQSTSETFSQFAVFGCLCCILGNKTINQRCSLFLGRKDLRTFLNDNNLCKLFMFSS